MNPFELFRSVTAHLRNQKMDLLQRSFVLACLIAVSHCFLLSNANSANAQTISWKFAKDTEGWESLNQVDLNWTKQGLQLVSTGDDPHMSCQTKLSAGWHKMVITATWQGVAAGQLFWATADHQFIESATARFREVTDKDNDKPKEIEFFFNAKQPVIELRLDPMARPGKMQIRSIVITDEQPKIPGATPVEQIRLAEGFKVELLYSVPMDEQGSWVSLAHDNQGRLIASDQDGSLYRITPPEIGQAVDQIKVEKLDVDIGMAQGLLYAFDSLYVMVNGHPFDKPAGLYRLQDTNRDDQFDKITLLREINGSGEHGPHAVVLSPNKKSLYVCGGNHTEIPKPETSRVPRNWQEDQLLPRMVDAGGHAVNIRAPGGWICKTDPEGKQFELIASGFRNEYDMAFYGEDLFTYDADMEWDVGSPWYRPTRVCHVTSGAEFGWRTGTGKWPAFYPDSLPGILDIGPGSPTGVCVGLTAEFPAKYQTALFIADWSYGIIYAIHLEQNGSSFRAEKELFCAAAALQVTDLIVNPFDGAMYFTIGGRKTQSGLYRVTYVGDQPLIPGPPEVLDNLFNVRRRIEEDHHEVGASAIERNWQYLNHADRFVRYAARIAIEHQPVDLWREKALQEADPIRRIHALIALARNGSADDQAATIKQLAAIDLAALSESQTLDLIRALGLAMIRLGEPTAETKQAAVKKFSPLYPNSSVDLNLELCRLLVAAAAPDVVEKTIKLLQNAPTQEEQIHYALCLRVAKDGWSQETRTVYFNWFLKAAALQGGHSFSGFLENIRKEAIANMTDSEREQLQDLLAKQPETKDPYADLKAMPFVKKWTVDELVDDVENMELAKRDLANGRKMFAVTQCFKCHRFEGQGGIVGPDLTAAGRRFNSRNLLEALIEPSKVVSDQYEAEVFELTNGKTVSGRVVNLSGDAYLVQEDMLNPGNLTSVNRRMVEDMYPSKVSMMPEGLLNNLTKEQILDLIAYIRSATADENDLKKNVNSQSSTIPKTSAENEKVVQSSESAARVTPASTDKASLPNVVLIISDDQAWTDYGFMGHEVIKTPCLDQLARESYTFTRGYVPTALCRPSLATIITGLYAHQHKISGNDPAVVDAEGKKYAQPAYEKLRGDLIAHIDAVPTLPKMLAAKGYHSFQTGKWWEGNYSRGGFTDGMTRGFPNPGGRHGDDGLKIGRQGMQPLFEFIDANVEKPFFIWHAPFLPHTPHDPPQALLDKYTRADRPTALAKYYAMCEWFDQTCGELLDYLDKKKLSENTIVIYVTDNGWIQRVPDTKIPQGWDQQFAPKSKQSPNEGGTRTPIMIRWPAKIKPHLDETTLVSSIDIAPTILDACGIAKTDAMHGLSLLDQCQGVPLMRKQIFGEGFAHDVANIQDPSKSLLYLWTIDGDWKLIERHLGRTGRYAAAHLETEKYQLFNLKNDPHEEKNLASEHPDKVQELRTSIERWLIEE